MVATTLGGTPVPVNVIIAPGTPVSGEAAHCKYPDNVFCAANRERIVSAVGKQGLEGEGEGEGLVLAGCWVITFEEVKVHESVSEQF